MIKPISAKTQKKSKSVPPPPAPQCTCKVQESGRYNIFDSTCESELKNPVYADDIINRSKVCIHLPKGFLKNDKDDTITEQDILAPIKGKIGVYHLWFPQKQPCHVHNIYEMECAYVGKGDGLIRAKDHLKEKYPVESLFIITFYECPNRIAKYLEQLFLDKYCIWINKEETDHSGPLLYAYWSEERFYGFKQTHVIAEGLAEKEQKAWNFQKAVGRLVSAIYGKKLKIK